MTAANDRAADAHSRPLAHPQPPRSRRGGTGTAERLERERSLSRKLSPEARKELGARFILIDCPPSLNIVSINILVAMDYLVIPIEPHPLSIMVLPRLFDTVARVRRLNPTMRNLGFLPTKVHGTSRLAKEMIVALHENFPDLMCCRASPSVCRGRRVWHSIRAFSTTRRAPPWRRRTGRWRASWKRRCAHDRNGGRRQRRAARPGQTPEVRRHRSVAQYLDAGARHRRDDEREADRDRAHRARPRAAPPHLSAGVARRTRRLARGAWRAAARSSCATTARRTCTW